MRYEESGIVMVCDACGAKAPTVREVAVIGGQEFPRYRAPDGWMFHRVEPAIALAGPPRSVDPFAKPGTIAQQIGAPVQACVCGVCLAKAKDAPRIVVDGASSPEVDEDVVGDIPGGTVIQ